MFDYEDAILEWQELNEIREDNGYFEEEKITCGRPLWEVYPGLFKNTPPETMKQLIKNYHDSIRRFERS